MWDWSAQQTTHLFCCVTGALLCVIQVVELITAARSDETASAVKLESVMERLMTCSVCYVASVSLCAAAQASSVNAKFWTSLEQRAFDVLEKVFCFLVASLTLLNY